MRKVYKFEDFNKDATISSIFETNGVDTDYSKEQADIISNMGLGFDFLNENIPVEPFYLFTESLINNMEMAGLNDDKDSVVYVTLCALAIIFEEPKDKYKKMFEELRLRGIYGALKPIVNATNALKPTFEELCELLGDKCESVKDMFKFNELFTPFMMAVSNVIKNNNIKPDSLEVTEGLSDAIVMEMKNLDLNGEFKETVDKIDIDTENIGNDIKKYGQFQKDVEMIQDDKEH